MTHPGGGGSSCITTKHMFEEMTPEKRPQDENMDGSTLTFETLEHGGEYPDAMPQAIRMTDTEGRECTYVPIEVSGKVVRSRGFYTSIGDSGSSFVEANGG